MRWATAIYGWLGIRFLAALVVHPRHSCGWREAARRTALEDGLLERNARIDDREVLSSPDIRSLIRFHERVIAATR